ncbi:MAG: lipid-A-disaccharide synthase [Bacteroidetes bacterium]|nr:lipid-A-disaccharide synthase [Bacteroidota bacterium]MBS1739383.1 lipid-A-disaccharide synthase [Bacteroidota bacterium]
MKYYIIAGEASGDLHGSNLIKAIRQQDEQAEIRCWGGDRMESAGATLVKHYRDLAFMGFVEVIMHLKTILSNIKFCKQDILEFHPDVLVLIDYPGFNMRIAAWAKKQRIKIAYYISPQIWAWKESRVHQIMRDVDRMLVILPFEKQFYAKWNFSVSYVGHPLVEVVQQQKLQQSNLKPFSNKPIIALLPGSRKQEIRVKLPEMLKMVSRFPNYQFVIAQAPSIPDEAYLSLIGSANVLLVKNQTYELLMQAKAALVTSGTATLETALFGVPQVVCYKGNPISYWLAKKLIKVKYISLVNLILDKPAISELIQNNLNEKLLFRELSALLNDAERQIVLQKDYDALWHLLGDSPASATAAQEMINLAKKG